MLIKCHSNIYEDQKSNMEERKHTSTQRLYCSFTACHLDLLSLMLKERQSTNETVNGEWQGSCYVMHQAGIVPLLQQIIMQVVFF